MTPWLQVPVPHLLLLLLQDFSRDFMLISKKRESCRLSMVTREGGGGRRPDQDRDRDRLHERAGARAAAARPPLTQGPRGARWRQRRATDPGAAPGGTRLRPRPQPRPPPTAAGTRRVPQRPLARGTASSRLPGCDSTAQRGPARQSAVVAGRGGRGHPFCAHPHSSPGMLPADTDRPTDRPTHPLAPKLHSYLQLIPKRTIKGCLRFTEFN